MALWRDFEVNKMTLILAGTWVISCHLLVLIHSNSYIVYYFHNRPTCSYVIFHSNRCRSLYVPAHHICQCIGDFDSQGLMVYALSKHQSLAVRFMQQVLILSCSCLKHNTDIQYLLLFWDWHRCPNQVVCQHGCVSIITYIGNNVTCKESGFQRKCVSKLCYSSS